MSGRRTRRLATLVAAVMVLLLAEGALIAWVFVSPSAQDKLEGAVSGLDRWWAGEGQRPGVSDRIDGVWDAAYEDWIAPLWGDIGQVEPDPTFAECVSCHPDYAAKRRFSAVYMNHPAHAELGVTCDACHKDITHPDPLPVEESRCEGCHEEVNADGGCVVCHPPASLPHFYLAGAPRDEPVQCESCHQPGTALPHTNRTPLVHEEVFDGSQPATCMDCHERQNCTSCHAPRHPDDWYSTHGLSAGFGDSTCTTCHDTAWCADACHAQMNNDPAPQRPLPTGGAP